ncbi:AlpA family transcriptional regulator [Actinoplanes sp. DH11]|uniref:helix-turn-helix transcriptional regulator n=1 Tax=Actinoplanes sp. DH11 TaxID=2857011 RepID=UPI001E3D6FA3|nr:hypothetical protein [Actinoplanes sp. DH11]
MTRTGKLMGTGEVTRRLGVSRNRADELTRRADFPAPLDVLTLGRVWWAADIEQWIREHRPHQAAEIVLPIGNTGHVPAE